MANFFDLTNVSVQVILFPLNDVLRTSLTFFGMESKKSTRTMLILFSLFMVYLTYHSSDGCWFVQRFSQIFPIERLHPTDKIWLVLIICLVVIISYYHLVSLHENNRDQYVLAASQCLYAYICQTSIQTLGSLSLLFQVIYWNIVWLYMLWCQSMPS